jgi:hypothetical protein
MNYGVEQKVLIYDIILQRPSWRMCRRKLCRRYTDSAMSCKVIIFTIATRITFNKIGVGGKRRKRL